MRKLIIFLFPFFLLAGPMNFIKNSSYVVDPYNNYRVTSESQGYGLLYAYISSNKKLFESMWKWTKTHMQREDHLFVWCYNNKILDYNNASDGDVLIAYSLIKANEKWGNDEYLQQAKMILNSLKELILNIDGHYVLLPGRYGFVKNDGMEVYPSYYIGFAFKKFIQLDPFFKGIYSYIDTLLYGKLSDRLFYSFFKKRFFLEKKASMDVYRVILYKFLNGEHVLDLRKPFGEINDFFKKNDYIPLRYFYGTNQQEKKESPYCVYKWFYLLYGNQKYLQKYESLKKVDKQNYFCTFLDYFLQKGIE